MSAVLRLVARTIALATLAAAMPVMPQEAQPSILRDAETEALFKDVARPLIVAAGLDPKSVQVVLVGDRSINAFAAGGQNVFIFSGLILAADNVNQLQGVIAHELGHVAAGHLVRFGEGTGPALNISILSLLLAGAAVAAGAPDAAIGILGGGLGAAQAKYLSFSRDVESRADAAGAGYLRTAGVSGRGMIDFFHKLLGEEYRLAIKQDNAYDRTHPLNGERIEHLEADLRGSPFWNTPVDAKLQARFLRIKGKLTGYVDDPQHTLTLYPESDGSPGARYARAYAWHRSAYDDRAGAEIDALLRTAPDDPYYLEIKGQILLEGGKPADAVPVLRRAVADAKAEPLIATLLGHALLSTEDPKDFAEAEPILKRAIQQDPDNPFAWYQLGVIYDRNHDEPRAALAQAESSSLAGEMKTAAARARFARAGLPKGSRDWLRADDIAEFAANELGGQEEAAMTPRTVALGGLVTAVTLVLLLVGGRAAVEAVVREYVLDHPELIPEAMDRLAARKEAKVIADNRKRHRDAVRRRGERRAEWRRSAGGVFRLRLPLLQSGTRRRPEADRVRPQADSGVPGFPGARRRLDGGGFGQPVGGEAGPLRCVPRRPVRRQRAARRRTRRGGREGRRAGCQEGDARCRRSRA